MMTVNTNQHEPTRTDASGGPAYPTLSVVKTDEFGGERMQDVPGMTLHDRVALEVFGKLVLAAMTKIECTEVFNEEAEKRGVSPEALIGRKAVELADHFVQARNARIRKIAGHELDKPLRGAAAEMIEHASIFVRVIEDVDNRCAAADGPVTPTLKEITEDELIELYDAARRIMAAASVGAKIDDDETPTAEDDDDGTREK